MHVVKAPRIRLVFALRLGDEPSIIEPVVARNPIVKTIRILHRSRRRVVVESTIGSGSARPLPLRLSRERKIQSGLSGEPLAKIHRFLPGDANGWLLGRILVIAHRAKLVPVTILAA